MSRVKNRDTDLELSIGSELSRCGFKFRKHVRALPGTPDIVFPIDKLAIFLDGDFWHGYRFPSWRHKLSRFWQKKIEKNRERDRRNMAKLRRMGWKVVRIWQHEIERDLSACVDKVKVIFRRR